jgi:hypothetical protein
MEPWAGGISHPEQKMRPWGQDIGWPRILKNSKDPSIVSISLNGIFAYDAARTRSWRNGKIMSRIKSNNI